MKQRRFILALGLLAAIPNRALAQPSFAKDVAPILQEKCQTCHRPWQMAPMSLITYEDVRPWVRAIKARVMAREMPPWYIDKTVGIKKFVADASLSDEQIDAIVRWVDAGAPLGNPKEMPPPRQWPDADSWQLAEHFGRPPDLIVTSPAFTMPAVSEDRWWDPDVDSGLTEDRWVQGVETKPIGKTRRILHHGGTNVFQQEDARIVRAQQALAGGRGRVEDVLNAGQDSGERLDGGTNFAEWAVGKVGEVYSENTGKLLKAGARIGWRFHFYAVGEEITGVTQTGFWFYPKGVVPKYRVYLQTIGTPDARAKLEIPPGSVTVHYGYFALPAPAIIQNFQPHMHLRGKAFLMEAIYPNGRNEVLSYVDRYSFNWHINYIYADDVAPVLPKGTVLKVTAWHDNTEANKANPDPRQWVVWGQRSVDEMYHSNTEIVYITEDDYQRIIKEREKNGTKD